MSAVLPAPRSVAGITLAQSAALVLPLVCVARGDTASYAVHLVAALIAVLACEGAFAAARRRVPSLHGVTTALIFTIVAPPDLAVWQVITVVSLGSILGELIFGGRGFGILHPAVVALALLVISFPQVQLPAPTGALALATLPGAVLLLALGLLSGRVAIAVVLFIVAGLAMSGHTVDPAALATALAFGLVFLVCDPVSAAVTRPGRWIYGALAGSLVVLFSPGGEITFDALVFAALLASICAPLIDHLVMLAHARLRQRRIDA